MYIIAGLGNPGAKYENTRHNVGFMAIDALAKAHGINVSKLKYKALIGDGKINGEKVILIKPQTFMNLSGTAIGEAVNFYKCEPQKLLVIYDDLDIGLGSIRIRKKGSAGTHNGMRSVVGVLGTQDFPRIRIGIGDFGKKDIVDFVIGDFSKSEIKTIEDTLSEVTKAIECFISDGIDLSMNRYNKKMNNGEKPANIRQTILTY